MERHHEKILDKASLDLVKSLSQNGSKLLPALVQRGVVPGDDHAHIEEGNPQQRNLIRDIIMRIRKGPPKHYMIFREVLIEHGEQELVANCLPIPENKSYQEYDNVGAQGDHKTVPVKEATSQRQKGPIAKGVKSHAEILDNACLTLVTKLEVKGTYIREALAGADVINLDDFKYMEEGNPQNRNQIRQLLDSLRKKSPKDYMTFRRILKDLDQGDVVDECLHIPDNPEYLKYMEDESGASGGHTELTQEEMRKKREARFAQPTKDEPDAKEEELVLVTSPTAGGKQLRT